MCDLPCHFLDFIERHRRTVVEGDRSGRITRKRHGFAALGAETGAGVEDERPALPGHRVAGNRDRPVHALQLDDVGPATGGTADDGVVAVTHLIGEDVAAGFTFQIVVPSAAGNGVVAAPAVDCLVCGAADIGVVAGTAPDFLDTSDCRTVDPGPGNRAGCHIDRDIGADPDIEDVGPVAAVDVFDATVEIDRIVAVAAGQHIRTAATFDGIVAGTAVDGVVAAFTGNVIVPVAAVDDIVAIAGPDRVVAGAAVDHVVLGRIALIVVERIVAGTEADGHAGGVGTKNIVVMVGGNDAFDAGKGIAQRIPGGSGARREIDGYRHGGAGIVDRVRTGAAVEGIRACAANQRIVAGASRQRIVIALCSNILEIIDIAGILANDQVDIAVAVDIGEFGVRPVADIGQAERVSQPGRERGASDGADILVVVEIAAGLARNEVVVTVVINVGKRNF